ncbi:MULTISPECIES: pyridoxal phosphate-dependent decarboxylase family protein [Prochlorococcus]|uniref:L-2,4-diaminobutyrate decarboxylase n=1 Tax=Prochlorococcus marinus (strain SARG / CCMP1375 / SS120) TaxID=167539 RepID=Q7VBQ7_PROMA|nr:MULTISPECIES: aminotransferase class V-fold PLP-dependent enzyme [Prochlorococcus]AAQ00080.1 L-2,4-diaminobutyrate decarboxylase [Prochlorococcus marinus subsp. marinus str. CCMP1375]KGG13876.1 pyridoxal-dependent decarboxylase family [Prochlorococcus marinus str. LG]KGG19009.1 pyridoxal-dependent decarboxylase family [Prochlorococcus marinus str. SS2]KGG23451.1 pyridoxal-dependent decarboxylase family [Prochlorococcus marinus str. SS35]KGG32313.1 pyridoxal-dependent decarboxylase family [P
MEFFASNDRIDPKLKSFLEEASSILCEWFATTEKRGPSPFSVEIPQVEPQLEGIPETQLLNDLKILMDGAYQPSHPGALAHLDPPPLTASIVGELIAAGLNNNLLAEELSPSLTKLERNLCRWFSEKIGLPDTAGGVSASGGTLTNLMALLVARTNAQLLYDSDAVVLASSEAHVSISRAISVMGLPPESLCELPTNEEGVISLESLEKEFSRIQNQGKKCFAVVATAGTTVRGAIDPLSDIAGFCNRHGIWFHVDAAIGGVFVLSSNKTKYLKDLSRANSVTINPQKLLGITKTSSLLLVAKKDDLFSCFSTGFPYIEPSFGNDYQGGEIGLQGSRPAEIIKLWLGLRQLGEKGINLLLDSAIHRRNYFHDQIDKKKFDVVTGPLHLIAISPKYKDKHEAELWSIATKNKLLGEKYMLSRPFYKDRYYLKAVMGNPHTKLFHIDQLAQILNQSI